MLLISLYYRIAGYFRGMPNFVIFVVNHQYFIALTLNFHSTASYGMIPVTRACAAVRAYHYDVLRSIAGTVRKRMQQLSLATYVLLTVPFRL